MRIHLVNPSDYAFGLAVIIPRWLYVLAAATPRDLGDPRLVDETLAPCDPRSIGPGDIVGIGIHSANALRGYEVGRMARERGATVVFGGIHATLFPDEPVTHGGAHVVVTGDGEAAWGEVLRDAAAGTLKPRYDGGKVAGASFLAARWDLLPKGRYMWGSVQTVRGCPKHCSFCSVWRTDGQVARVRRPDAVVREIVELRRLGFRFIALADDNFYPVTLDDLAAARRRGDTARLEQLTAIREERFELMRRLERLPDDMVFFTQITMEAAEDEEFLAAMKRARVLGALVGIETITPEGLKSIYKNFNLAGDALAERLRAFKRNGVHVLGSFIFGLPSDRPETFRATAALAQRADIAFAQFVVLTPYPGTVDFQKWEQAFGAAPPEVDGIPVTRHWLIPRARRPRVILPHPTMSAEEIRQRTQGVWDEFYRLRNVWQRAHCVKSLKARLAFALVSKLYRQMYANTGIATDSGRMQRANRWARVIAAPCRRLFAGRPMPELQEPELAGERGAQGAPGADASPCTSAP